MVHSLSIALTTYRNESTFDACVRTVVKLQGRSRVQDALNNGHPAIHILGLLGHALRRIHGLCLQGYILRRPCNDVMSISEFNTASDYSRTGRLEKIRWLDTITLGLG